MSIFKGQDLVDYSLPYGPSGHRKVRRDRYLWSGNGDSREVNPYTAEFKDNQTGSIYFNDWKFSLPLHPSNATFISQWPNETDAIAGLVQEWQQTEFQLGVYIAEGKESAEMIVHRLNSIFQAVSAVRKGSIGGALRSLEGSLVSRKSRKRAARKVLDSTFDAWMELRYGWMPLVYDIYAMADHITVKPVVNNVRNSVMNSVNEQVQRNVHGLTATDEREQYWAISAYASVFREPSWAERLNLVNPAQAWELMGGSWIVDWFLPIGSTINANYARLAMPIQAGGVTRFTEFRSDTSFEGSAYGGGVATHPRVFSEYVFMERSPGLGSILDDLSGLFQETKPKWDTQLKRMVDGSSLLNNELRRLR
uniref:Maturation protein n=1 Tax=Beihai levi-like virus 35 TaxID=1922421 RepID=A0A1L3KI84_9VIRU|nr:hypothetical protein [Beihai levi-like virus 35]